MYNEKGNNSFFKKNVVINLLNTKYKIFSEVAADMGWKTINDDGYHDEPKGWDIIWADGSHDIEKIVRNLLSFQRVNHFPGMTGICRKDLFAENMKRISKLFPSEYSFTPRTWFLPEDYEAVCSYLSSGGRTVTGEDNQRRNRCVIVKPNAGAQGKGIRLAVKRDQISKSSAADCVVQAYIENPLLIDGYKFDMRVYVLITSVSPLRILLFKEGLCRFCAELYESPNETNISNLFMHLTNYSINKRHPAYNRNDGNYHDSAKKDAADPIDNEKRKENSSKRSFFWLKSHLDLVGKDYNLIWKSIAHVIVKTILSIQERCSEAMKLCKFNGQNKSPFSCFEVSFSLLSSVILFFSYLVDRS
jgi:hypothetical protein